MPEGAEVVFETEVRMFECCGGCRLAIEEVYRVPLERANSIPFGQTYGQNGYLTVEPLGAEFGIEQPGVRFRKNYENDCSYIYHYGDLMDREGYQENDGYCYVHVWGRKRIGSEGGLGSWLIALSFLMEYLFPPILIVIIIVCVVKAVLKKRQQKQKD